MEIYPPHLRAAVEQLRESVLPGTLANRSEILGVFNRSKLWHPGQILRVCFFGGPQELRARVAAIARQWEKAGNIRFDFGDMSNPRLCRIAEFNEIRVGFEYKGHWSLIGQDSSNLSRQSDQSMNLEAFHVSPPAEPEFSRLVRHEFGHAIGLLHEHQNPKGNCEAEFDWEAIYVELAAPPNNWDKAQVDHNMRRLLNDGQVRTVGGIDKESIMLYTFPEWMYRNGSKSTCFNEPDGLISETDRRTVKAMYPADPAEASKRRDEDFERLKSEISASRFSEPARQRALDSFEVMSSRQPGGSKFDALQRLNAPAAR